jgi:FMN phosphatase YigB (HAD superfamily)
MSVAAELSVQTIREIVFESGLETAYERGELTTEQFYEMFCERAGKRPDCDALLRASSDMFVMNVEVAELLKRLRQAGHRLGVLSNTCEAHWDFCCHVKFPLLQEIFEVAALSYRLRAMKPEPEIYEKAAELARLPAADIFFVDDRPENVAGAQAAGFDAVQYTTPDRLRAQLAARGIKFGR